MVHVKPKRPLVLVPFLQASIDEIVCAQSEQALTTVLEHFDAPYHFERAEERNLLNWYKVLNRFDELLERYITSRDIFSTKKSTSTTSSEDPSPETTPVAPAQEAPDQPPVDSKPPSAPVATASDKAARIFSPSPFLVRLILRITQRLLRNSSHDTRNVYNSVEHIGSLMADDNSAIVLLSLEILNMLMQRSHKLRSSRTTISFELSERLIDMAAGWGGRENRLGMLECCSSKHTHSLPSDGSRLYFEYTKAPPSQPGQGVEKRVARADRLAEGRIKAAASFNSPPLVGPIPLPTSQVASETVLTGEQPKVTTSDSTSTIVLENVADFRGDERWLLEFGNSNGVPRSKSFALLSSFRRAKRFAEGRAARVEFTILRLHAIATLFQVQPVPPLLNDLLAKEPEILQDIVALAGASAGDGVSDVPRSLRIIAIRCLTAMSSDRHRVEQIMSATGVSAHHGALSTLLRTEIVSLLTPSNTDSSSNEDTNRPEQMNTDMDSQTRSQHGDRVSMSSGELTIRSEISRVPLALLRIHTAEALLMLVHSLAMAGGSSGATPLANSGVLGILIPLLTDHDIRHSRVVAQAIRSMQAIVEASAQALGCQLFRDQNGLALVAYRIAAEVGIEDKEVSEEEQQAADEAAEVEALERRDESRLFYSRLGQRQMTPLEALDNPPPSSGTTSRGQLPHSKWALLRALHTLLLRSLGNGGSEVRELVANSKLSKALRKIMAQPFLHGGSLFHSAASVTTEIAHAEPTATAELFKAGIATTILRTVNNGLPPCSEAIRCVPSVLAALCLAPDARDVIVKAKPLKPYLLRLATPFYTRALHGENPVHVGGALDELMRHVEALREDGNEAMIEYLKLSAQFVENDTKSFKRPVQVVSSTNTSANSKSHSDGANADVANKPSVSTVSSGAVKGEQERLSLDAVLLDKMKLAVANNSCRLAGFAQGSSEHQEGVIQNGGLEHIIQLRLAAALASSEASHRESYPFPRHYPTPAMTLVSIIASLRNFSSRHSSAVLKSLFIFILKDASSVLKIAKELGNAWLPQEDGLVRERKNGDDMKTNAMDTDVDKKEPVAGEERIILGADNTTDENTSDDNRSKKGQLRKKLSEALKKLRVGVVLLSGISRGGPGTSAGVWESARGSQVAAIISTVERAARYHLAIVYTGLTLSASSDGDLSIARVTAAADPELKTLRAELSSDLVGDLHKTFGWPVATNSVYKDACQKYQVPPDGHEPVRQEVKGLAWCLVTFAVAAQRLYSTLSKGLSFTSRRLLRDPGRYTATAKSLAATIGRIFALHLMAAERLWDIKVVTMGGNRVVAAWDYVRGILIEIKGTLFDESRRITQSLILRSFLDAGGAEALLKATRPFLIVQAASSLRPTEEETQNMVGVGKQSEGALDKLMKSNALSVSSYVLALHDVFSELEGEDLGKGPNKSCDSQSASAGEKEDTVMSSDSISHQARAISRMMVSEGGSEKVTRSGFAKEEFVGEDLVAILSDEGKILQLKEETARVRDLTFKHCKNVANRRVASDVWNTICGFLNLLGSCPGLLNLNSTPLPNLSNRNGDWEARDIQRSALTVTLDMLHSVMKSPAHLLSSFKPDGTAMADILGLVHTASQTADELSKTVNPTEKVANGRGQQDVVRNRRGHVSRGAPVRAVDPEMLQTLVEMGFPERRARSALRQTVLGGLEYATEWLLSHGEDDDGSLGSDGNPERRSGDEANGQANGGDSNDGDEEEDDEEEDEDDDEVDDEENEDDDNEDDDNEELNEGDVDPNSGQIEAPASSIAERGERQVEEAMTDAVVDEEDELQPSELQVSSQGRPQQGGDMSSQQRTAQGDPRKEDISSQDKEEKEERFVLDCEGPRLLAHSMNTELGMLWHALEKSKAVPKSDFSQLLASAAFHIGPTLETTYSGKRDQFHAFSTTATNSLATSPISIDTFQVSKKRLFESLVEVTKAVILESGRHVHGRYLPYFAVELLSVIRKDRALDAHGTTDFAKLLDAGLKAALDAEHRTEDGMKVGLQGQTAAIWSHYGGNHARRALQACGTFQVAYDCFLKTVGECSNASKSPFVDIEATQPIRKLSIREDKPRPLMRSGLTIVPKTESVILKRLTTCILLLDAMVRYESKDRIIQRTKESPKPQEDNSGGIPTEVQGKKHEEKMDTDKDSGSEVDNLESHTQNNAGGTASDSDQAMAAFNAVIQDFQRTTTSATGMVAKQPGEDNLDLVRSMARATKAKMVDSARQSIEDWTSSKEEGIIPASISKFAILKSCVVLLGLWKSLEVGDSMLAVLQLLGSITSDWNLAKAAIDLGIVPLLLDLPHLETGKSLSTDPKAVRILTKTILRHLIEDPETLKEAMMAEFRTLLSTSQSRARPAYSMKSLIMATSPMAARDILCYVSALTNTVRASGRERRGELQLINQDLRKTSDVEPILPSRANITLVISALSSVLASNFDDACQRHSSRLQSSNLRSKKFELYGLTKFALDLISDFVEFSQVAAVAFIKSTVPQSSASGSALDFVLQNILALPETQVEDSSDLFVTREREELSNSARNLFLALCSRTANTHEEAVIALASAVKLEADRPKVRSGVLTGLSGCIVPGTKLRVLRVMLDSGIANDLARSLGNLELGVEHNFDVAMYVLRALSLIGQAATHLARHGEDACDDISFMSSTRDPWSALRDPEDGMRHSSSYMVL